MTNISSTIKSIQDIMRKDVGVDGDAQRIGQLVWMFFLKIFGSPRYVRIEEKVFCRILNVTPDLPEL
jgi:type I restriction-modification system DNA methylase subunit